MRPPFTLPSGPSTSSTSAELETLAVAGHGAAVTVHLLAATYHWTCDRRVSGWVLLHLALCALSSASLLVHAARATALRNVEADIELQSDVPLFV